MSDATVTFNFNALTERFTARIGRILERASFLLRACEGATENLGFVPNVAIPGMPMRWEPRAVDDVRAEGAVWVAECALRDCVEEVVAFLESVRETCAALSLVKDGHVPGDRWNEVVVVPAGKFDKLTVPQKVESLQKRFGAGILDERLDDVLTLVQARNCLVHRRGVVAARDVNAAGLLVVSWRSLQVHLVAPDGRSGPVPIGEVVPGGGQLVLRRLRGGRSFQVGQQVSFTPSDLSDIWLTLHFFGVGTAKAVAELGASSGLVAASQGNPEVRA